MFTTKSKSRFGGPYSLPPSSPIPPFMTAERTAWLAAAWTANPTSSPLFGWAQSWAESDTGRPPARVELHTHFAETDERDAAARFQGSAGVVGKLVSDKSLRGGGDQEVHTHTHTRMQKYTDIPPSNTHFHMHLKQNKAKSYKDRICHYNYGFTCSQQIKTHMHTRTHLGTLVHIFKTPTAMFTHLRSTAARNHDNASGHNSLYCLKWSLIFSSLSQRSSNDMLELQPPHTAAMVNYHPPSENARRRFSWRRARLRRRLWPGRRRRWERVTFGGEAARYSSEHTRRMHEVHGIALGRGFMGWRSLYWPLAMRKGI